MNTILKFNDDISSNHDVFFHSLKMHCNNEHCPVGIFPCPFDGENGKYKECTDITEHDWKNVISFIEG